MKLSCSCNCHSNYKLSDRSSCGCCEGVEILTPKSVANQPGLYTLRDLLQLTSSHLTTSFAISQKRLF